jgi:hypothetical protein
MVNSESDVVAYVQMRKERVVLKQVTDRPFLCGDMNSFRSVGPYISTEHDSSRCKLFESGNTSKQSCLAGSRGSKENRNGWTRRQMQGRPHLNTTLERLDYLRVEQNRSSK